MRAVQIGILTVGLIVSAIGVVRQSVLTWRG